MTSQLPPLAKSKRRDPWAAPGFPEDLSLYIQFTNLEWALCQISGIYISNVVSKLEGIWRFWGLDKNLAGGPFWRSDHEQFIYKEGYSYPWS